MDRTPKELTSEELNSVAGGHPFESSFGDNALYRAGVSYVNTIFGADEYYIGTLKISKDQARELREYSTNVWKKYSASGDYIGYAREWKQILQDEYGISWDGQIGSYKPQVW